MRVLTSDFDPEQTSGQDNSRMRHSQRNDSRLRRFDTFVTDRRYRGAFRYHSLE
jgi:hypothetical protein